MATSSSSTSPMQQLEKDISSAEFNIGILQRKVNLGETLDKLEDIQNTTKGLPQRIQVLRSNNYIFEKNLEDTASSFQKRWISTQMNVRLKVNKEANLLKSDLKPIEDQIARVKANKRNISFSSRLLTELTSKIESLEDRTTASERTLHGMYDAFEKELDSFTQHLANLEWSVEQLSQASFKLMIQENLIMAVKATWTKDGKEDKSDPEGNLYLTDQRLLFEQKEEVATKKVLFFTTERELVQKLLFETSIKYVEKLKATEQGFFKNKDFLEIHFSSKAPYNRITLHLNGQDGADWTAMINKILSGDFDKDRTVEIAEDVVEKIENIPTICPGCGASISVPVYRGADQINCEYCGHVIRI